MTLVPPNWNFADGNAKTMEVFKVKRDTDHWGWKYFSNPHGEPVASVAMIDEDVVGFLDSRLETPFGVAF